MRNEVVLRSDWRWPPLPQRMPPGNFELVRNRHEEAMRRRHVTYVDPLTGLSVFTAEFLANRGYCCDSGCRHCPYAPESASSSEVQ